VGFLVDFAARAVGVARVILDFLGAVFSSSLAIVKPFIDFRDELLRVRRMLL
jgi:hypothetical protein